MSAFIAKEDAAHKTILDNISGERAAELITSSVSADLNVVNFDEVEAFRLKVKLRELVSVAPTDNGMSRSSSHLSQAYILSSIRQDTYRWETHCSQPGGSGCGDRGLFWKACVLSFP